MFQVYGKIVSTFIDEDLLNQRCKKTFSTQFSISIRISPYLLVDCPSKNIVLWIFYKLIRPKEWLFMVWLWPLALYTREAQYRRKFLPKKIQRYLSLSAIWGKKQCFSFTNGKRKGDQNDVIISKVFQFYKESIRRYRRLYSLVP